MLSFKFIGVALLNFFERFWDNMVFPLPFHPPLHFFNIHFFPTLKTCFSNISPQDGRAVIVLQFFWIRMSLQATLFIYLLSMKLVTGLR